MTNRLTNRFLAPWEIPLRTAGEADYLLMVDDEARMGALRFAKTEGGPFLAEYGRWRIPPLTTLPRLLSAADRALNDTDTDEDLRLLLAPGSSLGGARPKASVRDRDGRLAIAKFPSKSDDINTVMWEATALTLAAKAGIAVPDFRVEIALDKPVLLLRRFDRAGSMRLPFLSAMSMLGAKDMRRTATWSSLMSSASTGQHPKKICMQSGGALCSAS